jgi:hypothetical protein
MGERPGVINWCVIDNSDDISELDAGLVGWRNLGGLGDDRTLGLLQADDVGDQKDRA